MKLFLQKERKILNEEKRLRNKFRFLFDVIRVIIVAMIRMIYSIQEMAKR